MSKLFKEPLVQFLLIGACIYAAYAWFGSPDEQANAQTIFVSADRIDNLAAAWEQRWNRPPTEQELAGLVRAYLQEDMLYREAVAMGLDVDDQIVRRRLAQKLEFLVNDVVRLREPEDGELEAFFLENLEQFRSPDLITFAQGFFNPDKRGDATLQDAAIALKQLQAAGEPVPSALAVGDSLMLDSFYPRVTESDVRRVLGSEFAETLMGLEPGQWHGPVFSGFGPHLVYVYEFIAAPPPELDDVRAEVVTAWQRAETEKFNREYMESLKARYEVVIEAPAEFTAEVLQRDAVATPDDEPAA